MGTHIQVTGAAWHMRKPEALHGWYLKLKPDGGQFDARHPLRGAEKSLSDWDALCAGIFLQP